MPYENAVDPALGGTVKAVHGPAADGAKGRRFAED